MCCVVGDGEAETGPLATSWHSNKFLDPARDGAVLPILHLNGYKIANPTVLARIPDDELRALLEGYGYEPYFVEGDDPPTMHQRMAATLDAVADEIREIQRRRARGRRHRAAALADDRAAHAQGLDRARRRSTASRSRARGARTRCRWPRSGRTPSTARCSRTWLRSYRPEELFDADGRAACPSSPRWRPRGDAADERQPASPTAACCSRDLDLPDFRDYAVDVPAPGRARRPRRRACSARSCATSCGATDETFRLFGPDETASNRLGAGASRSTDRAWMAETIPGDDHLAPDGRVMEVLSEHQCQGWLEGYLLTGRHGLFNCYEAFIHIVDSMFNQHAKWLKVTRDIPWRRPIASLNYLLSSHVWRQDHNGFSPPGPGVHRPRREQEGRRHPRLSAARREHACSRSADHCLRSRNYVNVIVAGKQPALQLADDGRGGRCTARAGIGIWDWASNDEGGEPDVVLACAGDIPTLETLAAVDLLREHLPDAQGPVRQRRRPDAAPGRERAPARACPTREFDALFTTDKPVMFAYHGYPWLIHRLTYRRTNHAQPPRPRLQGGGDDDDAVRHGDAQRARPIPPRDGRDRPRARARRRAPGTCGSAMVDKRIEARAYTRREGEDMPEVADWAWPAKG